MGMDNFACDGFVISYENVKKLCPKEIKAIESGPHWKDLGWGSFSHTLAWQYTAEIEDVYFDIDDSEDNSKIAEEKAAAFAKQYESLAKQLCKAFKKKTDGLELIISHYNTDEGGRYDEVEHHDECVFLVNGMMDYTPAGKKLMKKVSKQRWIQFG